MTRQILYRITVPNVPNVPMDNVFDGFWRRFSGLPEGSARIFFLALILACSDWAVRISTDKVSRVAGKPYQQRLGETIDAALFNQGSE